MPVQCTCQRCGAPFSAKPSEIARSNRSFCSTRCFSDARRGVAVATPGRFWRKVEKTQGCWIWTGAKKTGGYGVAIRNGRQIGAHRLAWQLTYGPIGAGLEVCHRCDMPACVRPDHLFLGTHAENMADMKQKGRGRMVREQRGEANRYARLTDAKVREIRALYAQGQTKAGLGRLYGVNEFTIRCVVERRTWKHVS